MTQEIARKSGKQEPPVPAWVLDLLLGLAVTLVIALVITADQGGRQEPDVIAYLFACGFGGLMLLRRHFPVSLLVATMFLLFAYYALGYPAIGLAVPVSAALYSAAELGHLPATIIVSLLLLLVSTYFRYLDGQTMAFLLGYELISSAAMMAAAIALGDSTRSRRVLRAEQEQTTRLIAQEHAYQAEQRVQAERVRMARELHDVIGHSLSVILLHAAVAQEALGRNEEEARQALTHIRTAGAETMRELRTTVKVLRKPDREPPERAMVSLTNLTPLLNNAAASGLHMTVNTNGMLEQLPRLVDMAAYRIIQEALTNVIRHAQATEVILTIAVDAQAVRLQMMDNGAAPVATHPPGNGIAGMTERARLLGGTLTAQPRTGGGFVVTARLPLEDTP